MPGCAKEEISCELFSANAGDVTWLPRNVQLRFIFRSRTDPLRIFWNYGSVSATRTLVAIDET